jgi:hypothetical protein
MQNFGVKSEKKVLLSFNFKLGSKYLFDSLLTSAKVVLFPYDNKMLHAVDMGGTHSMHVIGMNNEILVTLNTGRITANKKLLRYFFRGLMLDLE